MDRFVRHARPLSGVALLLAYPVLLGISARDMPAAVAMIAMESAALAAIPFALAFLAQLALKYRKVPEAVLLVLSTAAVLISVSAGGGLPSWTDRSFLVTVVMSSLLLTWYLSLATAAARWTRARRSTTAEEGEGAA